MPRFRLLAAASLLTLTGCQIGDYHHSKQASRTVRADVVALDQPLTYNRFGSFNPYGMIYALKNDVEPADEYAIGYSTCPNRERVRLKHDVRPRPLVLRGNEGDRLQVRFTNRLMPNERGFWGPSGQPNMSKCQWHDVEPAERPTTSYQETRYNPYPNNDYDIDHGNHTIKSRFEDAEEEAADHAGEPDAPTADDIIGEQDSTNWPRTRTASFVVSGMTAMRGVECDIHDADPGNDDVWHDANDPRVTGIQPIPSGACFIYEYALGEPGTHLFFSLGAPSGGQGDGGSLVHGLFGSVNVQPAGSEYYRSQVTQKDMDQARKQASGKALIDFQAKDPDDDTPLLDMLQPVAGKPGVYDLVHGDLNAIIVDCHGKNRKLPRCKDNVGNRKLPAFREFTVIFHDELKTFYPEPIEELGKEYQLEGVGDGFAINYGASGMGSILLANRKGFGPAKDCLECLYEEFFLQSWTNGDPALLATFEDDPSNVHHSYLGDRVEFRNLHAGPKETHVFHLHAHQWLAQRDDPEEAQNFGTYLDSQTVAPQQGFAYEIYYGGSGNRNQTPGDSIFHCHLYPHFAQGMWALWRVHDVFEDGSRRLPDGQAGPGTDPDTGATDGGTPIPAIVPLPKQAMPPAPTYVADVAEGEAMPGYPFYIAGRAGHRAPQPPLDFARDSGTEPWQDGGLPRHVFTGKGKRTFGELELDPDDFSPEELVQLALRTGDFSAHLEQVEIDLLDNEGEPIERAAMKFHAGRATSFLRADDVPAKKPYESITPEGWKKPFRVNQQDPQPGAPFADPCKAEPDKRFGPERTIRYDVSAIQLDLIVNKAGWHDPQARINVLTKDADALIGKATGDAEPFFFRTNSRDCIEFRHTNRTPKDLELDDFQVMTPTDTIGQHIHLVKFDVTSSDGSGNGFNYEDGTLAPDEVRDRIEAAKAYTDKHGTGDGDQLTRLGDDEKTIQTTVQRWYADPLLSGEGGKDRTIRTVFTHDHFAPSSIQHHGFYSALLVEPKGSTWRTADGKIMCPEQILDEDGEWVECEDRPAVGARAIISGADDSDTHPDHREFAMAIADFGLLYEPKRDDGELGPAEDEQGLDHLLASLDEKPIDGIDAGLTNDARAAVDHRRTIVRAEHGVPVDPPLKPESISKNHHNPYLVNYRNEPLPLRLGDETPDANKACDDHIREGIVDATEREIDSLRLGQGHVGEGVVIEGAEESIREQHQPLDTVFNSKVHGDPCTPVLEAYEGERLQVRMIQGAQEVQHMFEIQGMSWPREIANPQSPHVAAQEIGISEHFEMEVGVNLSERAVNNTDRLYRFSTVDDLWNGAWGLLRAYPGVQSREVPSFTAAVGERLWPVADVDQTDADYTAKPSDPTIENFAFSGACPIDAPARLHVVDAVTVSDVLGQDPRGWRRRLLYNPDHSISDPDAIAFMPVHSETLRHTVGPKAGQPIAAGELKNDDMLNLREDRDAPAEIDPDYPVDVASLAERIRTRRLTERAAFEHGSKSFEPIVLRARAGECVIVRLRNLLLHDVENGEVVPAKNEDGTPRTRVRDDDSVEAHLDGEGYDPRHLPRITAMNAEDIQASQFIGLTPQLMHLNVRAKGGAEIGWSDEAIAGTAVPGKAVTYHWYAGEVTYEPVDGEPGVFAAEPKAKAHGPVNLVSLTDVIEQGQQGLIGALIVEEENAVAHGGPEDDDDWLPNGTRARIDPDGSGGEAEPFHEFVLMYQDGLNLRWRNPERPYDGDIEAVPDCLVCDDSYDRGEKAVNYRTEPFWARLNKQPTTDLNGEFFDERFFLDDWKTIATPGFEVEEDEAVTFHVLQPYGRARQRAFMVLGQDYQDLLPHFGSPHSALISVGKAVTAKLNSTNPDDGGKPAPGKWIWRDGPAQHFSSGVWGSFEVEAR